jgi:hypothetical protein
LTKEEIFSILAKASKEKASTGEITENGAPSDPLPPWIHPTPIPTDASQNCYRKYLFCCEKFDFEEHAGNSITEDIKNKSANWSLKDLKKALNTLLNQYSKVWREVLGTERVDFKSIFGSKCRQQFCAGIVSAFPNLAEKFLELRTEKDKLRLTVSNI